MMGLPPDWPGPPRTRVAWWRARGLVRQPALWVVLAALLFLAVVGLFWAGHDPAGCVPHYAHDGRPVVTCDRHP